MIRIALSFISGIASFNFYPFFPVTISVICILGALISFLAPLKRSSSCLFEKNDSGRSTCIGKNFRKKLCLMLVFATGFLYSSVRQDMLTEIIFPDGDLIVQGTIVDVAQRTGDKLRFTVDDVLVEGKMIRGSVRLLAVPELFEDNINESLFDPGNRISALAKLRSPAPLRNPGAYSQDLKRTGIAAVGLVRHMQFTDRQDSLKARINTMRKKLGRIIDTSLTSENASFHKAIIPGLKMSISEDMRDAFSTTGLAHLLSISGTHFGLLAFIIFSIARSVMKGLPAVFLTRMTLFMTPTQTAVVLTLPVLTMYAAISGFSIPTIRSFIMVFIYMLAPLLGRKDQWLNSLSIAAIIILLWKPDALMELSFLLSFAAVFSIGYVLEKRAQSERITGNSDNRLKIPSPPVPLIGMGVIHWAFEKVKTGMLITVAAVLGTAPIVALYFKQFAFISPIANLLVTPLACFIILPLGFIAGSGALIFNMSSLPLMSVVDAMTHFVLNMIKVLSRIPFSSVHVHNPSIVTILLYYSSLIFFFKSRRAGKIVPFILVIGFYLLSPSVSKDDLRITFLDAGQGDASVLELPDKKVMLIDGGTREPDMGRRVIAPFLWSKGIRKIDYMVMSHPHPDHYGGLLFILDNFEVREIWFSGRMTAEVKKFFHRAAGKSVTYRTLRRGDMLESNGYRIYVLHPYDEFHARSPRGTFSSENSDSLVLKIESDNNSILFTGDIEEEAEENLVYLGKWLKSDILKVPHHGGRTSSSLEFIEAVYPDIAVVSSGRNNAFRHPHHGALQRYKSAVEEIFRTDMDGAVTVISKRGRYEVQTYLDGKFKKAATWGDERRNLKLLF